MRLSVEMKVVNDRKCASLELAKGCTCEVKQSKLKFEPKKLSWNYGSISGRAGDPRTGFFVLGRGSFGLG